VYGDAYREVEARIVHALVVSACPRVVIEVGAIVEAAALTDVL